jgi:hypothetical protein
MAETRAGADVTTMEEDLELDEWMESRMQWHGEEQKKDSGWMKKNGEWECEDVSDVSKQIHACIHTIKPLKCDNFRYLGTARLKLTN